MFTFTFYKHNSMDKTVVSGHKYNVEAGDACTVVSVFPEPGKDGECYYLDRRDLRQLSTHPADSNPRYQSSYRSVFVTNEAGKTIDRIEPPCFEDNAA